MSDHHPEWTPHGCFLPAVVVSDFKLVLHTDGMAKTALSDFCRWSAPMASNPKGHLYFAEVMLSMVFGFVWEKLF